MNDYPLPHIVSATDIRYKFKAIAEKINRTGKPAIVVDNSKPLVVIYPHAESKSYSLQITGDPHRIYETRKKVAPLLKGWDVVDEIRKMRDTRYNFSPK